MTDPKWKYSFDNLIKIVEQLGFTTEFGVVLAKNLKYPKSMDRMSQYLLNVKPKSEEIIVDEMLAIVDDCNRWIDKKESENANAIYNDYLNRR